jgi:hypothetical protein
MKSNKIKKKKNDKNNKKKKEISLMEKQKQI